MKILEKLFLLFIFVFPTGVIARLQLSNGIAITLNDIFLSIFICCWIIFKIKTKKVNNYLLFKPIALFIIVGLMSLILNFFNLGLIKFLISGSYLLRITGYLMLYFIVKDFSINFTKKINVYLLLSGFFVLIIGYLQYFLFPSLKLIYNLGWDEHLYRMVSVFLDPNFAGAFFNIYFIFTLNYLRVNYKKFTRIKLLFYFALPIFSLIAVYLTYSRSALIMLFVCVITYLILIKKKKLIIFYVSLLIILIFVSPRAFQTEGTNLLRIVSSTERISSMQIALTVIKDNPVFGVGFNAYRYAQNKLGLNNIYWQTTHSGAGTDASLLFVIATTGFVGFISFVYFIYSFLKLGKLNINKDGIVLLTVLIGLIANSLFINSLFYVLILEWVYILSGITENS